MESVDCEFPTFVQFLDRCRYFKPDDNLLHSLMTYMVHKYVSRPIISTYNADLPSRHDMIYNRALEYMRGLSIEYGTGIATELPLLHGVDAQLTAYLEVWQKYISIAGRISIGIMHVLKELKSRNLIRDATTEWANLGFTLGAESRALEMMADLRRGYVINTPLLKSIISHIEMVGVSMPNFITSLQDATISHYRRTSEMFINGHSTRDYIYAAAAMIREDYVRCDALFCKETMSAISTAITDALVINYRELIFDEYMVMLRNNDLSTAIYALFSRDHDHCGKYVAAYEAHWKEFMISELKKCEDRQFVECLLGHYKTMQYQISTYFSDDAAFTHASKRTMRVVLSSGGIHNPAPIFAEYLNLFLKKTGVQQEESDKLRTITHVISVTNYISDKDAFIQYYSKLMGTRLITNNSSASLENEAFVALKQQFGIEHTLKLKIMLEDIKISNDFAADYLRTTTMPFAFTPVILTQSAWSLENNSSVNLIIPHDVLSPLDLFGKYYKSRFSSKRLNWVHSACRITVARPLNGRTYQFLCTMEQYLILIQFDNTTVITKAELPSKTGVPMDMVEQVLASFTKARIIGPNKDKSKYGLSPKFTSDMLSINCSALLVSQQINPEENKQIQSVVSESRKQHASACIVRNMKKHKKLEYRDLRNAVFEQTVQFAMTTDIFKAAYEYCVEKEYITTEGSAADKIEVKYIEA